MSLLRLRYGNSPRLADKWWRDADQPDSPEGNQKYLDFYESSKTMRGKVTYK
jgi:hypothetical protein